MTEDEKFCEVFADMKKRPTAYSSEAAPAGRIYVGDRVMLGNCNDKWSITPRGIHGTASIPVPRHLVFDAKAAAKAVDDAARDKTRNLPSFLHPR
jgi:hypothetical protein